MEAVSIRKQTIRRHLIDFALTHGDRWQSAVEIAEATGLTPSQVRGALKTDNAGFRPDWVEACKDTRESNGMSNFTGKLSIVNVFRASRRELLDEIRRLRRSTSERVQAESIEERSCPTCELVFEPLEQEEHYCSAECELLQED